MGNASANTSPEPIVSFKNVYQQYSRNGEFVLENINLEANEGDLIALIGPSGCGKSTMLKLISGLTPPTSGRIIVDEMGPDEARAEQAFVFQDSTLLPWLNVRKNVELPMRLRKLPRRERERRALELLDLVRLTHVSGSFPRQLSGGMKMRTSIARALSLTPKIMLLDEPFGALDEMTRNKLNEDLLEIRKNENWTAFFVTHSVNEAVFLSNRIAVFSANPGRIHKVIQVPFPYPRDSTMRDSIEFHNLVCEVSEELSNAQS